MHLTCRSDQSLELHMLADIGALISDTDLVAIPISE